MHPHSLTFYTPFYLLFGGEVRLPVDVMFGGQPQEEESGTFQSSETLWCTLPDGSAAQS